MPVGIWEKSTEGRGNSKWKGSETGSRTQAQVDGTEGLREREIGKGRRPEK